MTAIRTSAREVAGELELIAFKARHDTTKPTIGLAGAPLLERAAELLRGVDVGQADDEYRTPSPV